HPAATVTQMRLHPPDFRRSREKDQRMAWQFALQRIRDQLLEWSRGVRRVADLERMLASLGSQHPRAEIGCYGCGVERGGHDDNPKVGTPGALEPAQEG